MPGEVIRVATLNLWGQSGPWDQRRQVLIDGLREIQPDLVAFQESIKTDEYDQVADLLTSDFQVIHQKNRQTNGSGISIASRWPVEDVQEVDLHVTPRTGVFSCAALMAEIRFPDPIGPLLFVNHFPNWELDFELERELQAVVAAKFIEERVAQRNMHIVLVGDLDADPSAASIRFWAGRQSLGGMSVCYRDAWESAHPEEAGHTFTPRNALMNDWDWPFRRIDYIFVRCGKHGGPTLAIASCERIFDEPVDGVWASDHFGLVADLVLPPRNQSN
jgi:endonuclease/exonuclease/phosphatase family metal-dependent hydrolase